MQIGMLTAFFFNFVFLCKQIVGVTFWNFTKDVELNGFNCPHDHIVFREVLSLSQCSFMCIERGKCYGFFYQVDGQCVGCDKFPQSSNYAISNGTRFYGAPLAYILSKYSIVHGSLTWYQTQENCTALGGTLVEFGSNEERELVETNVLHGFGELSRLWIGAYDENKDGNFLWSDGSPVNDIYIKWAPGQPDLSQQCVFYEKRNGIWHSHDYSCGITAFGICELN